MKFVSTFFIILLTFNLASAQNYFVVHVKGDIERKTNNEKVKIGDQLTPEEELRFLSQDALAVVMSKDKGRMVIDGKETEKAESGEFISFVKDAILPMKSNLKMSTRGGDYRDVQDFKSFFGEGKYVIIGEQLMVKPNKEKYPVNDQWSFIYRYETPERPVNKKVAMEGDALIFNKNKLYKTKGETIDPDKADEVDLIYFNLSSREAKPLANFEPVFVNESTLMLELKSVASFLQNNEIMGGDAIKQELYQFVLDVHGPTNKMVFDEWLTSKNLLTKNSSN